MAVFEGLRVRTASVIALQPQLGQRREGTVRRSGIDENEALLRCSSGLLRAWCLESERAVFFSTRLLVARLSEASTPPQQRRESLSTVVLTFLSVSKVVYDLGVAGVLPATVRARCLCGKLV